MRLLKNMACGVQCRAIQRSLRERQQAGVDVIRPGIALKEIFHACATVIKKWGLAAHAPIERVGHGVGLDMHEPPSIAYNSETIVEENMVLTVEPIFTDQPDGQIGNFALEDVVVVTAKLQENSQMKA